MQRDSRKCLFDMLDSCRFLVGFVRGKTIEDLRNDRGFRSAVERELQIVGEALWVLSRVAPETAERISENKRVIRFRHVLVHGYDIVDYDIVWTLLRDKLPLLEAEVESLLKELGSSP